MNKIGARYEFRTFAPDFGIVEETIRRLAPVTRYRESHEVYFVSTGNSENNTKVRDALMDIKVLVNRERGLEQWSPRMKGEFPLQRSIIHNEVFPAFGTAVPELRRDVYSFGQFLDEIIIPHPDLAAVNVYKQRFGFDMDGCTAELANVYINGALLRTACLESLDPDRVLATRQRTYLGNYENVNYLLAIKRVIGMEPPANGFFQRTS